MQKQPKTGALLFEVNHDLNRLVLPIYKELIGPLGFVKGQRVSQQRFQVDLSLSNHPRGLKEVSCILCPHRVMDRHILHKRFSQRIVVPIIVIHYAKR